MKSIITFLTICLFMFAGTQSAKAQTTNSPKDNLDEGQVVFYSQANLGGCSSIEVTVFTTLEEYFGTATLPAGGGVIGVKTFSGVFPDQEATCDSEDVAVFKLPVGKYYVQHISKNCFERNGGDKQHTFFQFAVEKDQCTKVRLSR